MGSLVNKGSERETNGAPEGGGYREHERGPRAPNGRRPHGPQALPRLISHVRAYTYFLLRTFLGVVTRPFDSSEPLKRRASPRDKRGAAARVADTCLGIALAPLR